MPSKKPIGLIAGILVGAAVAVTLLVLVLTGAFRSKAATFAKVQQDTLLDPLAKAVGTYVGAIGDPASLKKSFSDDITVSFDSQLGGWYENYNDILNKLSVLMKLDVKDGKTLANLELNYSDSALLTGAFTYDGSQLGFCLPELDPAYYTAKLDQLMKTLGNEEDIDSSMLTTKDYFDGMTAAQAEAVIRDMGRIVLGTVNKDNVKKSSGKAELETLGYTAGCDTYVFQPTEKELTAMLKALGKYLEDSDDAYRLYCGFYRLANFSEMSYYSEDEFKDQMKESYRSLTDGLADSADDTAEMLADGDFAWTLGIKGKRIYLEDIRYTDQNGTEQAVTYESYGEAKKTRSDALVFSGDGSVELTNEFKQNGKAVTGELTAYLEGSKLRVEYDLDTSKKSGLGLYYGEYTMRADSDKLVMTVEKADNGGTDHTVAYDDSDNKLAVIINSTDKKSTAEAPSGTAKDISDYSSDELGKLFSDMGSELESILYQIEY